MDLFRRRIIFGTGRLAGRIRTNAGCSAAHHPQHRNQQHKTLPGWTLRQSGFGIPCLVAAAQGPDALRGDAGTPRALFLTGYDSYEALQKNEEWMLGDTATDAKFDALDARQAPNVSEVHNTIWHYRPDLSNNVAAADIPHTHYWEVLIFHMRPGHDGQFEEMTKLYRDAHVKIEQNIPWSTYEAQAGVTDAYLVLVPMTSLKDEDTGLAHEKDFGTALGDEGRNRMNKLSEEGVTSVEDNIWMVVPEWSYVEKSWIEADPQYWGPEPAAKPAAKHAAGAAPTATH